MGDGEKKGKTGIGGEQMLIKWWNTKRRRQRVVKSRGCSDHPRNKTIMIGIRAGTKKIIFSIHFSDSLIYSKPR